MSDRFHQHRTINGSLIACYHTCRNLLTNWQFWVGITLTFPLEHALWEKVWPFKLLTKAWGL